MVRDDPRCLPSTRTLRRIRWPLQPRSRDRHVACAVRDNRWMTLSRHPGPSPVHDRSLGLVRLPSPFRSRRAPTFHRRCLLRARSPFTLAATLFGALRVSVFETRRRLPTSATLPTCGHFDPSSRFLAGTEAATSFLFSMHHAASLPGAVDARRAALRPLTSASVPVLPTCVGLPDRDEAASAPPTTTCAAAV